MTPAVRIGILATTKPHAHARVAASLEVFARWLQFVNFAGVGQTYQQRVASLGGLNKAIGKFEVMS